MSFDVSFPSASRYQLICLSTWTVQCISGTGLYTDLLDWIKQCRSHYPWLRFATTYQANAIIQKYLRSKSEISQHDAGLSISNDHECYYEIVMDEKCSLMRTQKNDIEIHSQQTKGGVNRYIISLKRQGDFLFEIEATNT